MAAAARRDASLLRSLSGCRRLGLFGGSFNPPHNGHLYVARRVVEACDLDFLVLIPAAVPPHKTEEDLARGSVRLDMLEVAIQGADDILISDLELRRDGVSYTVDTVGWFREKLGSDVEIRLFVGSDAVADLPSWKDLPTIMELCQIVIVHRPGHEPTDWKPLVPTIGEEGVANLKEHLLELGAPEVSSTEIRRRVREGRSYRELVPSRVADRIEAEHLYR